MDHKAQQLELAFGAAEGTYNERKATLINALRSLPRGRVDRNVATLVFRVFEATAGATRLEGVALSYEEIADQTDQGLWSSKDTAERVVKRCLELGLLVRDCTRAAGRQGKNIYWLAVRSVVEMAGGICRSIRPISACAPEPQSAAPPPQNAALEHGGEDRRKLIQQQLLAAIHADRGTTPRMVAPHCTNERQELLPMYQSNALGMVLGSSSASAGVGLQAMTGVGGGLLEQLAAATDPAEQKRRLVARITASVADARMGGHVARAAADLVVFHGVPQGELEQVLADVEAMRASGGLNSAGAFFHSKARTLAGRHGKPWPKGKSQPSSE